MRKYFNFEEVSNGFIIRESAVGEPVTDAGVVEGTESKNLIEYLSGRCFKFMPEKTDEKFSGSFYFRASGIDENGEVVRNYDFRTAHGGFIVSESDTHYSVLGEYIVGGGTANLCGFIRTMYRRALISKDSDRRLFGELKLSLHLPEPDGIINLPF
ncbi:MAG: hypothetical protein LBK58_16290 [Prevotellaceae bacterium]|jgi:hypothetical protein|nr:hypothetical protein [Prevotellaceae bacterium]